MGPKKGFIDGCSDSIADGSSLGVENCLDKGSEDSAAEAASKMVCLLVSSSASPKVLKTA
jgi:hypothetical protein